MSATTAPDWGAQAEELREAGVSQRQIADELGVPRSTVGDYFRSLGSDAEPAANGNGKTPSDILDEQAGPGEARTPLPPRGQQTLDGGEIYLEEIRVDGTKQLALGTGGKEPTSCKLSLGGSAEVNGRFSRGERITGTFVALIVGEAARDKLNKRTQIVTECGLTLTAKVVDLVVDPEGG